MPYRLGAGHVHGRGKRDVVYNVKPKLDLFAPTLRDEKSESVSWIAFEQRTGMWKYFLNR